MEPTLEEIFIEKVGETTPKNGDAVFATLPEQEPMGELVDA